MIKINHRGNHQPFANANRVMVFNTILYKIIDLIRIKNSIKYIEIKNSIDFYIRIKNSLNLIYIYIILYNINKRDYPITQIKALRPNLVIAL